MENIQKELEMMTQMTTPKDIEDGDVFHFTQKIIQEIVKEQDEHTMLMIEEYVKKRQREGECIAARIIPEGQMRHVINLGLTMYAKQNGITIRQNELFPQEDYIEYLRDLMIKMQNVIQEKNKEITELEEKLEYGGE